MKRTASMGENEPEKKSFPKPSEAEHLFQVVDVFDYTNAPGRMTLDEDTVCLKLEVAIGDELGRGILHRLNLNDKSKGFFATRLFLKAIGEPHKGEGIEMDTDRWIGRQFYATVVYNGDYANLDEYNFEKSGNLSQHDSKPEEVKEGNPGGAVKPSDIAWEE